MNFWLKVTNLYQNLARISWYILYNFYFNYKFQFNFSSSSGSKWLLYSALTVIDFLNRQKVKPNLTKWELDKIFHIKVLRRDRSCSGEKEMNENTQNHSLACRLLLNFLTPIEFGTGHSPGCTVKSSQYSMGSFSAGKYYKWWRVTLSFLDIQNTSAGQKTLMETQIANNREKDGWNRFQQESLEFTFGYWVF